MHIIFGTCIGVKFRQRCYKNDPTKFQALVALTLVALCSASGPGYPLGYVNVVVPKCHLEWETVEVEQCATTIKKVINH
jgi:hypothetical protein